MAIAHIYNTVSATNASVFTTSLWCIPPADGSDPSNSQQAHLINCETNDANLYNRLQVLINASGVRSINWSLSDFIFGDPTFTHTWSGSSIVDAYTPGSWHHIWLAGDTSADNTGYCYVNGVSKFSSSGGDHGFNATWNGCVFGVPTTPGEAPFHDTKIQMAEVQIWLGTYIDPTADNLAKFVKVVGGTAKPQDPVAAATAFGIPTYSFRGNSSQFSTNHGNGGAMASSGVINSYTPVPG